MGITLFSPTGLLDSLQGLLGWFSANTQTKCLSHPVQIVCPAPSRSPRYTSHAKPAPARPIRTTCSTPGSIGPRRPVRVLRVIDTPQPTANAGRMRISGRMADVCAELDRMAALEPTHRNSTLLQ